MKQLKDTAKENTELRKSMRDLRAENALLRVKATTTALGNRRILRDIKRKLRKAKP